MLKRTPLFEAHRRLGGRLVEFGGWEMPVQYTGIIDEHLCVRRAAGIFDISHMGEVLISGPSAAAFLNQTLTNDVRNLAVGQGQYTLMCNERGGVIDDLYLYRTDTADYLLIINASRIEADVAWLGSRWSQWKLLDADSLSDESEKAAAVAIQGPRTPGLVDQLFVEPSEGGTLVAKPSELQKNQLGRFRFAGECVWVARTGYSGEDGFEVVTLKEKIEAIWNQALAIGHPFCLQPCGLGARDTLRTEMCYPLYGHELDEQTTPIEAGLSYFIALDKGDFVGRDTLASQKAGGVAKKCVAFRMTDKSAPPRPHYPIWTSGANARQIGEVVSGTQSPSLGCGIGLGYVPPGFGKAGTAIEIEIRGKRAPAVLAAKPLYRKTS